MKNIHFVHGLHNDGFNICDRIAIASAWMNNPDWSVFLWCPNEPTGEQWEKLKAKVPVRVMFVDDFKTWNGKVVPNYQHRADLIRHAVLYAMGGVYADTDTITLAPFPKLWLEHDAVLVGQYLIIKFPCNLATVEVTSSILYFKFCAAIPVNTAS